MCFFIRPPDVATELRLVKASYDYLIPNSYAFVIRYHLPNPIRQHKVRCLRGDKTFEVTVMRFVLGGPQINHRVSNKMLKVEIRTY